MTALARAARPALPPFANILDAAASAFAVPPVSVMKGSHARRYVEPRHAAMRLAQECGYSTPTIARELGGMDHTSVLHGIAVAVRKAQEDPDFARRCERARMLLKDMRPITAREEAAVDAAITVLQRRLVEIAHSHPVTMLARLKAIVEELGS